MVLGPNLEKSVPVCRLGRAKGSGPWPYPGITSSRGALIWHSWGPLWHSGPDPRFGPKVDDRAFEGRFDLAFVGSFVAFRRLFCSSVAVLLFCCWTAWIPFGDHPLKLERYRED